jgi:hypothetical protein
MVLPTVVFVFFALASAAGAYLLFAHQRGPRLGMAAAAAVLVFFAALFWLVLHLVAGSGMAGTP